MKKITLSTILLFTLITAVSAQQNDNVLRDKTDTVVGKYVQAFFTGSHVVGLSIGVYQNCKFKTYNYGEMNRVTHELPTTNTLYNLASITKTMTGALLAMAAVEGKVKLDDDIRKYLDGDYPNLEYDGQPIRLYQLLNHRSGLPGLLPNKPEAWRDTTLSPNTIVARLWEHYSRGDFYRDLHKVKLDTVPGFHYSYSNVGGQLCGYILEKVYSKSYEELVKAKLGKLLQMRDTKITLTTVDSSRFARGYDQKGSLTPDNPVGFQAAGGVKSTISDMLKYIKWQTEEKDQAVVLSHQSTTLIDGDKYSQGLNWSIIKSPKGIRVIWQNGNIPGSSSLCVICPELKIGIVILANASDNRGINKLGENIVHDLAPQVPEF